MLGQSEDSEEYPSGASATIDFDLTATGETNLGIPLTGSERVAILIRRAGAGNNADTRLRRGGEATNSPQESYADAELDFVLDNHVIYTHEDPEAGDDTDSHGTSIRGNIRIYYSVTIDHGSLLGDGNVHPDHIESTDADTGSWAIFPSGDTAAWRAIADTDVEVAFPNVLTGLLGPLGATPNVGEALELLDDLHNRVCPAASGGTDGQVCARNTAGTAYELVDGGAGFGGLSELTSVQLANADQLLVSDVSDSGGTTKYSTAMTIAQRLSSVSVFAGLLADGDYVSVIDISEPVGDRVKRIGYDTLRDELTDTIIAEIVVETPLEGAGTTGDPFGMTPASIVTGFLADEAVTIAKMGSGTAASGDVATADGSGGVEWQAGGGGGGGGSFDLHDDVTGYIGSGALSGNDRMVVSDESLAGDPNRYAEVDDVVQRLYALGLSEVISTGTPADNDLVFIGDTSRGTGNRVRAIELSDLLERLDVGDIGSGSATDGQVATADGSGGIDGRTRKVAVVAATDSICTMM